LATLQQQHQDLRAALALLLGRGDAQLSVAGASLAVLTQPVLVGASPAQLLLRRPDVASAEAALAAANANVEVARAAFFPRVAIDLGLALQNPGFNAAVTTLQGTGLATSLAVSAIQPLFNGGKLQANKEQAVAQQQMLLASYRSSILGALIDAQRAVSAATATSRQLQQLEQTVTELQAVVDVLQARYLAGQGDRLALLDAQRAAVQARGQQQQSQAQRLQASVTVFRAFGGGWQVPQQGAPL
jgi:outer membrane protein TolC